MNAVVQWDTKHVEWVTHFADVRGEYGRHLIIGHTTGNRRLGSARNIEKESPCGGKRPKPLTLPAVYWNVVAT